MRRLASSRATQIIRRAVAAKWRPRVIVGDEIPHKQFQGGLIYLTKIPRVSIIIATHNRSQLLPRAVESALKAGTNVEIIVVDDASTDATPEACRSLPDIRYVRAEHKQGLGGARNLGILASRAEFISFLDDDDVRLPGSLDVQLDALASAPEAGLVYGQAILGDQDCNPTARVYPAPCPRGDIFWELLECNFIACPSAVFRRSCLYRVGLLGTAIPGIEDWDLWVRIAELYPVIAIEQPVAIYRKATCDSGQFTSDAAEMVRRITAAHRKSWLQLPRALSAPAAQRRTARRRFSRNMANHLIRDAGQALKRENFLAALNDLLTALSLHPLGFAHWVTRPSKFSSIFNRGALAVRRRLLAGGYIAAGAEYAQGGGGEPVGEGCRRGAELQR